MQKQPFLARSPGQITVASKISIRLVAHYRQMPFRTLHAKLMAPARAWLQLDQRQRRLAGTRPDLLDTGSHVATPVFADVDNKMTIAQEEIFGPVLSLLPYDTEEEAVAIANDSDFGLAGSVWTQDVDHGYQIATKVRTGTYGINWYAFDMGSPFGGYKCSGIGREDGPEGLAAFCELKSILMPMGYTG